MLVLLGGDRSKGPLILPRLISYYAEDINGALGTLGRGETRSTSSLRQKLRLLLVIAGPGLIAMGGGNDVCQEMVVRLGAVTGVGHGRLISARFVNTAMLWRPRP
jgi:hypothetical protein